MQQITIYHGEYRGFDITFSNGITASVQMGKGETCTHSLIEYECTRGINAEVVAIDKKGDFITKEIAPEMMGIDNDIIGYMPPDQIAEFLYKCKNYNK